TLTTVAVFAPVLFVPGIAGVMFRDMALTICFSLTISLLVALTLVPLAASRLIARQRRQEPRRSAPVRALLAAQAQMTTGYLVMLRWSLRHRALTLLFALATLAGAGLLWPQLSIDFMPKTDHAMIIVQLEAAIGSGLEEMDRIFRRVEEIVVQTVPERTALNVEFGAGQGFMAMFSKGGHSGVMRIKLCPLEQRGRHQSAIEEELRQRLEKIPGVRITMLHGRIGFEEGDIVIELYGHDLTTARALGPQLVKLARETPGTADVVFSLEQGSPELRVVLDRHRLAALGLNAAGVASTISTMMQGTIASLYREGGNEYDILVRAPREFRSDVRNLEQLGLSTPTGKVVPLASVARVESNLGPVAIQRQNQQRVAKVTMSVPGSNLGDVTAALEAKLARVVLPQGFYSRVTGTAEDMKDSFRYLGLALLVAVLLVYMVMASQFESLVHPFVIIFSVPLAAIGVVLALYLWGAAVSVTALIGVIMLVGIVVNNAIVLVDFINQLRELGTPLGEAIVEAGRLRLRPVLMTAGTTVLGMVPLALELSTGAEMWSPLGRTVIGG
ncbi:MAG: efflux RND transporter permease subunit, partial [Deltaproteobacteria bacterium]|nr:efflux RND transporter permease subunit [Deltaproteobacteria bacterium]